MSLVYIEMCSLSVVFNKLPDSLCAIVPSGYRGEAAKLLGGQLRTYMMLSERQDFVRDINDISDTLMLSRRN